MSSPSTMLQHEFSTPLVDAAVEYRVLRPADWTADEQLPLVLHLHGALSSSASLELARPHYDRLWATGDLPRVVVACPSTPTINGFYLDRPGARWESVVAKALPDHLAETYGPFPLVALFGASMGGFGALAMAFAHPDRYTAVAALSPAVFPGESPTTVPEHTITSVLGDLHSAMSEGTDDETIYASHSVYGRARAHSEAIRRSGLDILVDCGAADEFGLHEGAEYLHGVLDELGIRHEYRLIPGAGHLGPEAETRTTAAIAFLGQRLGRAADVHVTGRDHPPRP